MQFEAGMEIQGEDGSIEELTVRLPDVIMNSTSTEWRQNHALYERPYYT